MHTPYARRLATRLAVLTVTFFPALFTAVPAVAAEDAFPSRTIRWIVAYPPGGTTDILARIMAQRLSERTGQQVVIDNRGGAGNNIGTEVALKAPPDGYTLLLVNPANAINTTLYRTLPFDFLRDYAPVAGIIRVPNVMEVTVSLPAKTVAEFITHAKANPGRVILASSGSGTSVHLSGELFKAMAGVDLTHVPYKGAGPALVDLIGGQVQVSFNNLVNFASHVKAGKLKGIAISGDKRNPVLPDVPTFAESGLPGFVAANWFGMLAPAATPKDIIQKINTEIGKAQGSADTRDLLAKQGIDPFPNTVAATEALLRADYERFGKIIRDKNIKADTD